MLVALVTTLAVARRTWRFPSINPAALRGGAVPDGRLTCGQFLAELGRRAFLSLPFGYAVGRANQQSAGPDAELFSLFRVFTMRGRPSANTCQAGRLCSRFGGLDWLANPC
jgi:hypothetical protein